MKKLIILVIFSSILFCSCSRVVVNEADLVQMNKWHNTLTNGTSVTLKFKDDVAILKGKSVDKDACFLIKGLCFFDKSSFLISDKTTRKSFKFDYYVTGNRLKLTTDDGEIILKRLREKTTQK